ncbi:exported hypothetical protein [Xanthomonas citri pv. fuscans]|uniref:Secreted protein n=1 Tax=Xanthomonas campestris pv. phaseoli TaxID=317013 RepID=A0A7Z7IZM0_XANCH|nr:exported hypothetical protein [Xanthomonas citri pv. fuscans]SOO24561.1 exported hypothetical protein [Xanthomonas phaseoli pv. phaseoli]
MRRTKASRNRLVIFSPPILTALQAGACAHLSTALCNFHPQGVWKRCVALHVPDALRPAGACVRRDKRGQRSGIAAADNALASPDPLLGVTQKKLGSHARHRHLAVAMYLRPGVNP